MFGNKVGIAFATIAGCLLATSVAASSLDLDDAIGFFDGNDPFGGKDGGFLEIGGYSSPSLAKCDEGTSDDGFVESVCDSWEDGKAEGDYSDAFELTYTTPLSFDWSFDASEVDGITLEDVLFPKFVAVKSGIAGGSGSGYYVFDVTGHISGTVSVASIDGEDGVFSRFNSISHVSFYDTGIIPLPAAGWLLLSGLGGMFAMRRRRKSS